MRKLLLLAALLVATTARADVVIKSGASSTTATVDSDYSALRVALTPRGRDCYSISAVTGTMAAALAANATVFAMRIDLAGGKNAYVYRVGYEYTTLTAGAAATAGLNLALFRAWNANTSGGNAIATVTAKDPAAAASEIASAQGGDARLASTAALTVTSVTFDANAMHRCHVGGLFAANSQKLCLWDTSSDPSMHPIELNPGQMLVVRNGATAFPATQTWQLVVNVEWCERT